MSDAKAGVGTTFRRKNAEAVWENITDIFSINGPGLTKDIIDVTSLDSAGKYREFIAGFKNSGTVNLKVNFTRRTYYLLFTDFESKNSHDYSIDLPDLSDTSIQFRGIVTELPLTIPADDKIAFDCTFKISGGIIIYTRENDYAQYLLYTDGLEIYRKGVRDYSFVIDKALTLYGFSGIEGIDWENVEIVN